MSVRGPVDPRAIVRVRFPNNPWYSGLWRRPQPTAPPRRVYMFLFIHTKNSWSLLFTKIKKKYLWFALQKCNFHCGWRELHPTQLAIKILVARTALGDAVFWHIVLPLLSRSFLHWNRVRRWVEGGVNAQTNCMFCGIWLSKTVVDTHTHTHLVDSWKRVNRKVSRPSRQQLFRSDSSVPNNGWRVNWMRHIVLAWRPANVAISLL
jgi:hypothetical protein